MGSPGYMISYPSTSNGSPTFCFCPSSTRCSCLVRSSKVARHICSILMPMSSARLYESTRPAFCAPVVIVLALRMAAFMSESPTSFARRVANFGMLSPCRMPCVMTDWSCCLFHRTALPSAISFDTFLPGAGNIVGSSLIRRSTL